VSSKPQNRGHEGQGAVSGRLEAPYLCGSLDWRFSVAPMMEGTKIGVPAGACGWRVLWVAGAGNFSGGSGGV
jgi:hypothetical protein